MYILSVVRLYKKHRHIFIFGSLVISIWVFNLVNNHRPQSIVLIEAQKPKKNKTLNINFFGEIAHFSPVKPDGLYVWQLQSLLWERFIEIDSDKIWHPSLAKSWSFSKDQTELYLQLMPNLKWSNGRRVDIKDFKFSVNFYKVKNLKAALFQPIFERIEDVSYNKGVLTLKLNPKKAKDLFFASSIYWSQILSSMRLLPHDLEINPYLGTGLYTVLKFSNHKPWQMALNKKSWRLKELNRIKWPSKIKIKTFKSQTVLAKSLDLDRKAIVIGLDLKSLNLKNIKKWSPINDKVFTKSLKFNLNRVPLKDRLALKQTVHEVNDLEKLKLENQYRNFRAIRSFNTEPKKIDLRKGKTFKIDVLYTQAEDSKWLIYLKEKLRGSGVDLIPKLVSSVVFNEYVFDKKFNIYVYDYESDPFYPLYLVYHSKGEYNSSGLNLVNIDRSLEELVGLQGDQQAKLLSNKIYDQLNDHAFEIPLFSYKSSMLWARNRCKPIQEQFKGLGLIYKAVICTDNL